MKGDKNIQQRIACLEAKIEHKINYSSGSVDDESRIDDLSCELLKLEEAIA